jgi:hypothetical protein
MTTAVEFFTDERTGKRADAERQSPRRRAGPAEQ